MPLDTSALKEGNIFAGIGGGIDFGTIGSVLLWIVIGVVVIGIIGGIAVFIILRKSYKLKIWVFGKVGGVPMLKIIDAGKLIAFGSAGDKLLKLKKLKKYLPPPRIQMGKDIYWFYEREDGEFINFSLTDIDEMQREAGAYFVDIDMRMQRLGIEKNLRDRMTKQSFLQKYAGAIAGVIFVIMVTICLVVLFSKLVDVADSLDKAGANVGAMASAVEKFYRVRVDGESPADVDSGLVPAFLFLLFRRRKWIKKKEK